jgi:hypothetical protein
MKIREEYTCPLELTHDLTKGKWKPAQSGRYYANFSSQDFPVE